MKSLLMCLALAAVAALDGAAQPSLNVSVTPPLAPAGASATLTISFTDASPSASVAGLQWTLVLPPGISAGAPAAGSSSTAAQKLLSCNGLVCLALGSGTPLNATPIGSGAVASIPLSIAAGANSGPVNISLAGVMAANSSSGSAVTLTSSPATLTVLSRYDLTGDGSVNNTDVQLAIDMARGATPCSAAFSSIDPRCGVVGAMQVLLAALGLIH